MHDNKLFKILRIVFLTLAILSLVFTLSKKVGLCAGESQTVPTVSGFPLAVNGSLGVPSECSYVKDALPLVYSMAISDSIFHENDASYTYFNFINEYSVAADYSYVVVECRSKRYDSYNLEHYPPSFSIADPLSSFPSVTIGFTFENSSSYGKRYTINSDGTVTRGYTFNPKTYSVTVSDWLESTPSNGYTYKSTMSKYPLWLSDNFYSVPLNGYSDTFPFVRSSSGGTDSPGFADPELDWGAIDQILNTTQLISDTVDNTWTNFTFWQRLLNTLVQGFNNFVYTGQWLLNNLVSFFKPVFDSILNALQWFVSFFNTLFSALTTFFESILDFVENGFQSVLTAITTFKNSVLGAFSSITTSISGFFSGLFDNIRGFFGHLHEIYEWFYNHGLDSDHEFDFMVLYHYLFDFDTSAALTAFQNNKYGDFILDVRDFGSTLYNSITGATASERVFFTISLGDHFGTHFQDITIDFDWYASIRDTFLPYLMAFVYVSAIWLFIKRLPDIIHGAASAESSFRDELSGQEFAPTSHGIFTRGVSKNQPSLDKSPLSGGGGVHSGSSQFWY